MKRLLIILFIFLHPASLFADEKVKEKKVAKYIMENIQKDYLDCYSFYKVAAESFKKAGKDQGLIKNLENSENFTFSKINLSNQDSFDDIQGSNFDCVIHLAARAGVRQSFREPKKYILDNTVSTTNLSGFVKKEEIQKFLIASTSSIYGDSGETPMKEDIDEKYPPPSVYASSKLSGELMAKTILDDTETCIQIPRFFTVYGPYGRPDMSILRFIHWIYTGTEILLYGDGNQKRSFTYIDDVISGLNTLILSKDSGVFNIGSDKTVSLNQVISIIEKELNIESKNAV